MRKMEKIVGAADHIPYIAWRVFVASACVALTYRVLAWGFGW